VSRKYDGSRFTEKLPVRCPYRRSMDTRIIHRRRLASGLLAGAVLLAPLAGCGDTTAGDVDADPDVTATESAPAEETGDATASPESGTTGATGTDGGTNADVNCSGTSCSITLSGNGAEADILGTTVALGAVENGRATVRIGDRELACNQGERISAGPLTVECTTVSEDAVTMTASLG
jgi:hypothetical protein